jgi:hypothetical protein
MPSYVTMEGNLQFAEILESICVKLQITDTQFNQANQHYKAVGELLSKPGSRVGRYSPHIYPQGSLRLDTTVKPQGQNEFDLDAVCKLYFAGHPGPQFVYDMVWDCMYADGTYRPMGRRFRSVLRSTTSSCSAGSCLRPARKYRSIARITSSRTQSGLLIVGSF